MGKSSTDTTDTTDYEEFFAYQTALQESLAESTASMMEYYAAVIESQAEDYSDAIEEYTSLVEDEPLTTAVEDVDWTETQEELYSKAVGEFTTSQAGKVSRQSTVHTSPLLDEEEAETTSSVLTG
jgi:hypothetical protein